MTASQALGRRPSPLRVASVNGDIALLQRTAGNRAVAELLSNLPRTTQPGGAPLRNAVGGSPAAQLQGVFFRDPPPVASPETSPSPPTEPPVSGPVTIRQAYDIIIAAGLGEELNKAISQRVGQSKQRPAEPAAQYVFRKLAEGPDIHFTSAHDLLEEIRRRVQDATGKTPGDPALRLWRKLNRIAGQLERMLGGVARQRGAAQDMREPLNEVLAQLRSRRSSAHDEELLKSCTSVLTMMTKLIDRDPRGMWFAFQAVCTFGPLGHALVHGAPSGLAPRLRQLADEHLHLLRTIRQFMVRRQGLSVIAHRGSGPTNRTMGSLIGFEDQRRRNRPAENSPEAFEAALSETTRRESEKGQPVPRLDGIECDVFLSSDGVPILSHEGNVREQLAQELWESSPAVGADTHIYQLTKAALLNIKRTPSPESRFMTLEQLLDMVAPHAITFFGATGNPLRVEIEMKGTKHDKDFARKGSESPLTVAVARVVSRAIKRMSGIPVEYLMFNGTPSDIPMFSALRQTKTALGGLYTGIGPKERDPGKFDPLVIDELRYQFSTLLPPPEELQKRLQQGTIALKDIVEPYMQSFVLTLVYGQEMAPREHPEYASALQPTEPSLDIGKTKSVSTALRRREKNQPLIEDLIQRLLDVYVTSGNRADMLHVLTDYPKKAWWMKRDPSERN